MPNSRSGITRQRRRFQGVRPFDPHREIPQKTAPLLFKAGGHIFHHCRGVVFVEVLAAQAIDAVEQRGHGGPPIDLMFSLAFPARPQGDLQGGLEVGQKQLVVRGARSLQNRNDPGVAHPIGQLFVAGRIKQHRPHHADFVAPGIPVIIHHVFHHAGRRPQQRRPPCPRLRSGSIPPLCSWSPKSC